MHIQQLKLLPFWKLPTMHLLTRVRATFHSVVSLPRSHFLDVTQRSALIDINCID